MDEWYEVPLVKGVEVAFAVMLRVAKVGGGKEAEHWQLCKKGRMGCLSSSCSPGGDAMFCVQKHWLSFSECQLVMVMVGRNASKNCRAQHPLVSTLHKRHEGLRYPPLCLSQFSHISILPWESVRPPPSTLPVAFISL